MAHTMIFHKFFDFSVHCATHQQKETAEDQEDEQRDETESNTQSYCQAGKQPVQIQRNVLEDMEKEMEELGISPPSPSI